MKLLIIYADKFGFKTTNKGLENAETVEKESVYEKTLVGFIHFEEKDEENIVAVETKMIKQLKWAARKNETESIVLHSFAHLSESKGSPELTKQLFNSAEERLKSANYKVSQTPFGYFLDLDVQAPGHSFARLFKEI
jgi:dihydroorotase-like cyclic amidohydrolase